MSRKELIDEFENETGLEFDPNGPDPVACEFCDGLLQFVGDHECWGIRAENHEAEMMAR